MAKSAKKDLVECPVCSQLFVSKGLSNHVKAVHPEYKAPAMVTVLPTPPIEQPASAPVLPTPPAEISLPEHKLSLRLVEKMRIAYQEARQQNANAVAFYQEATSISNDAQTAIKYLAALEEQKADTTPFAKEVEELAQKALELTKDPRYVRGEEFCSAIKAEREARTMADNIASANAKALMDATEKAASRAKDEVKFWHDLLWGNYLVRSTAGAIPFIKQLLWRAGAEAKKSKTGKYTERLRDEVANLAAELAAEYGVPVGQFQAVEKYEILTLENGKIHKSEGTVTSDQGLNEDRIINDVLGVYDKKYTPAFAKQPRNTDEEKAVAQNNALIDAGLWHKDAPMVPHNREAKRYITSKQVDEEGYSVKSKDKTALSGVVVTRNGKDEPEAQQ